MKSGQWIRESLSWCFFLHEYQRVDFPEGRNSAGSYMMTRLFQKHLFFPRNFSHVWWNDDRKREGKIHEESWIWLTMFLVLRKKMKNVVPWFVVVETKADFFETEDQILNAAKQRSQKFILNSLFFNFFLWTSKARMEWTKRVWRSRPEGPNRFQRPRGRREE